MAKKTSVTQIPMLPHNYYDLNTKKWVFTDKLRHAEYEGERVWDSTSLDPKRRTGLLQPVMIDNVPFYAVMTYVGYYRGRSAAGMRIEDEFGIPYTVFLTDFDAIIRRMTHGKIKDTFIYCKRGRSYGIKLHNI